MADDQRKTYDGLVKYFAGIKEAGKTAHVIYSKGGDKTGSCNGEVVDISDDCVVLYNKHGREVCIPYHAICTAEVMRERREKGPTTRFIGKL